MLNFKLENLELDKPLGSGTFGKVYAYKDGDQDDRFVVKEIICSSSRQLNLAIQEIVLAFNQQHEFINPIIGFKTRWLADDIKIYMKMPRQKRSLHDLIEHHRKRYTHISYADIIRYFSSITSALIHLKRQNIYHRDIKPKNILLDENDGIKISDLGSSKYVFPDCPNTSDSIIGTQGYMAPEIEQSRLEKKERKWESSDIWSLGITIVELCLINPECIEYGFSEEKINQIILNNLAKIERMYGRELSNIIAQMLKPDPESRINYEKLTFFLQNLCFSTSISQRGDLEYTYFDEDALIDWGRALLAQDDLREAKAKFQEAIQMNRPLSKAYYYLNKALYKERKLTEIEQYLKETLEVNSDSGRATLASVLSSLGKHDEAIIEYEKISKLNQSFQGLYEKWGKSLYCSNRYEEAQEILCKAITIDPSSSAYYILGLIYCHHRQAYPEAIAMYEMAIELDSRNYLAYRSYGDTLVKLGRQSLAIEKYLTAKRLCIEFITENQDKSLFLDQYIRSKEIYEQLDSSNKSGSNTVQAIEEMQNPIDYREEINRTVSYDMQELLDHSCCLNSFYSYLDNSFQTEVADPTFALKSNLSDFQTECSTSVQRS